MIALRLPKAKQVVMIATDMLGHETIKREWMREKFCGTIAEIILEQLFNQALYIIERGIIEDGKT